MRENAHMSKKTPEHPANEPPPERPANEPNPPRRPLELDKPKVDWFKKEKEKGDMEKRRDR
jgi:hypothetical protein